MRFAFIFVALALIGCGSDDGGSPSKNGTDSGTGGSGGSGGSGGTAGMDAGADAQGDAAPADGGAGDSGADAGPSAPTVLFPKSALAPEELAVLVNENDPVSVELGDYYLKQRGIPQKNLIKLKLTVQNVMPVAELTTAQSAIDAAIDDTIQGYVITWTKPYRADCMSVTSAFALGYDKKYCNTTGGACGATASIDYFGSDSVAPRTDHKVMPAMMLAAKNADDAKALVDRGVAADDTFPPGKGFFVRTTDKARSVRWPTFQQTVSEWDRPDGLEVSYVDNSDGTGENTIHDQTDLLYYFTGLAKVADIETNSYRPGAVADHLTSYGGQVPTSGQMSVVAWLEAGATGSFGTVVEPCNYTSKFPNTKVLLEKYFAGATLLEAYWKSVAAPGEGLFVGEPLARPWGKETATFDASTSTLTIETTHLDPTKSYAIESADAESGPFSPVQGGITVPAFRKETITVSGATAKFYRLVQE
ncbi:MAG: TIGR03790 family protein [Myxococcales bacterium]|nr:TIGR03790 family protein [Myxococcales bacterium]MCB9580211.1 TIGR03790 family protein [Polyangiaceae bacterium]